MRPTNKKFSLFYIIVLLIICGSAAIYGTAMKIMGNDGKPVIVYPTVNIYDRSNTLIGTYTCQTVAHCELQSSIVDDGEHNIEYLHNENKTLYTVNNRYGFINDNNTIILYDITNKKSTKTFSAFKDYGYGINGYLMIAQATTGKWGLLNLMNEIIIAIPFQYDFIAGMNSLKDNQVDLSAFLVKDSSGYQILNSIGEAISNKISDPVTSFNANYYVTTVAGNSTLYSKDGSIILNNYERFILTADYVGALKNNELYIINPLTKMPTSQPYTITDSSTIQLVQNNTSLTLYADGHTYTIN